MTLPLRASLRKRTANMWLDLSGIIGYNIPRLALRCSHDRADWGGFRGLSRGLRDAVRVDEVLNWDGWKATALRL